jgi:alpha-glucosidase
MLIYQIYPRSFADDNHDGLGDLCGITKKLPYLASLGVDTLWISPFFKSPMKDFGYDVSDYCLVDPLFGTMEDFDHLIAEARSLDLGIMIDMVLSHSSDQHPWFLESCKDRTNSKSNWYVWADPDPRGGPPNNWMSLFGGSAWEFCESRGQYYLHNFLKSQPDFNFHEPAVQKALLEACEFWLQKGVRGFRLDVCNFYFHSKGLENNPIKSKSEAKTDGVHRENPYNDQFHIFDKDRPENLQFLNSLRALTDNYEKTLLMGEVVSDHSLQIMKSYISEGHPLHTAYCFALFQNEFNGDFFAGLLQEVENLQAESLPTWALGNHDVPRFISRFKAEDHYPQSAKAFLFFLFLLRGHLILFQGDELGLNEAHIPRELMQDPFGIEFYPEFKGRDGCRTPMPWNSQPSSIKTWLPIPQSHLQKSVADQDGIQDSVLEFTRRLILWRKKESWIERAPLQIKKSGKDFIAFERSNGSNQRIIGLINGSPNTHKIFIEEIGEIELGPFGFKAWKVNIEGSAEAGNFQPVVSNDFP